MISNSTIKQNRLGLRRIASRQRYLDRMAAELCVDCGGKPRTGKVRCIGCNQRQLNQRRKCKDERRCVNCGADSNGLNRCQTCQELRRRRDQEHRRNGGCGCGRKMIVEGKKSCEHCLARGIKRNLTLKLDAFDAYGGARCACCGETAIEFLQLDHVHNDGAVDRKRGLVGGAIYRWLKNHGYPIGFQVLCANCNFAKGLHGYCPHKG